MYKRPVSPYYMLFELSEQRYDAMWDDQSPNIDTLEKEGRADVVPQTTYSDRGGVRCRSRFIMEEFLQSAGFQSRPLDSTVPLAPHF